MNTNTARWVLPSKDEGLTSGNPVDLNNLDTVEVIDDEGCIAFTLKSTGLSVKWLFTSISARDRVYINVLERLECSEGMLDGSDLGDRNREINSRIDARFKQLEKDGKMGKPENEEAFHKIQELRADRYGRVCVSFESVEYTVARDLDGDYWVIRDRSQSVIEPTGNIDDVFSYLNSVAEGNQND